MSVFPSRSLGSDLLHTCRRGSSPYAVARGPIGGQPLPLQLRAEARGAHSYHVTTPDCRLALVCGLLGCPFHLCTSYQSRRPIPAFLSSLPFSRWTHLRFGARRLASRAGRNVSTHMPAVAPCSETNTCSSFKNSDDNTRRYPV